MMRKGNALTISVIVVLFLGIVGVVVYQNMGKTTPSPGTNTNDSNNDGVDESLVTDDEAGMLGDSGGYVAYEDGVVERYGGTRRVLFFYANWCPTCRPADANFSANVGQLPADVTVIRVNYNDDETDASEEALAEKYSVTYQHTFVQIDDGGNAVKKWNGGQLNQLLDNII